MVVRGSALQDHADRRSVCFISDNIKKGYRALTNINEDGGQEVPHLHFHLFGGEKIGKMVE